MLAIALNDNPAKESAGHATSRVFSNRSWCHTRRRTYEYIEDVNQPPPELRVNHILRDFEKFGKTFDCQLGDVMTPHFKCSTW
ncbi:hypothetical protein MTO96_015364 [Rhipicephalus appendiculatus]